MRRQATRSVLPREGKLVENVAAQAASALERTQLFNESHEALEQQTASAEVLRVISNSVADTEPVFEKVLESCPRLFSAD